MGSFMEFTWDMGIIYGGMGIYGGITVLYPITNHPMTTLQYAQNGICKMITWD